MKFIKSLLSYFKPTKKTVERAIALADLPYPMFKTTEREKQELRRALEVKGSHFLCLRINLPSLEEKIDNALCGNGTLSGYLYDKSPSVWGTDIDWLMGHREVRDIWVRKLLEYK